MAMRSITKFSSNSAKILNKTPLETSASKWIGLQTLDWEDQNGNKRKWELAHRKTRSPTGIDAVAIFPILQSPSSPPHTLIILQYRPPVEKICIEFPAGLIDPNETAEESAIRELIEETGYGKDRKKVEVINKSTEMVADPGMSNANLNLVTLKVQVDDLSEIPVAELDEGENIEVRLVPIDALYDTISEYEKLGYIVDAKLAHLAWGLKIAKQFT